MSQEDFREVHKKTWKQFQSLLTAFENKNKRESIPNAENFPKLYRKICHHLDLVRYRNYGTQLADKLNRLALSGHQCFYSAKSARLGRFTELFLRDFPRAVRKDWRLFWMASTLFYGPFAFIFLVICIWPDMVYSVLDADMVAQMKEMYRLDGSQDREFSDDMTMFGFYIYHNTGIGLKTFGSSLILGVGSIFTLIYNGLVIGAVFGYLFMEGLGERLFPFVVGHGSFELTAIVIAGMAGLKVGLAFLMPKSRRRVEAITHAGKECFPLIYGFVAMFFVAAFIEGFWSPISSEFVTNNTKYTIGGCLWFLVFSYFVFVGRRRDA